MAANGASVVHELTGLTHGLGRVELGRDFSVFGGFGWDGSIIAKVLKI